MQKQKSKFHFELFQGLLPIKSSQIPAEVIAGLTLAALAIPEVMGYTKIAGTPVITGLYTMLIPMVLFAIFSSSKHLVVGADSATAAILAAGLIGISSTGSEEYLALASALALMSAVFLIMARVIGLAFMADFLSRTVLIGFLTGVGLQVAFGQISGMLGLKGGGHGTLGKVYTDIQQIQDINFYALSIAITVIVVIIGSKKISKKIPGALIAVVGAIAVSWILDLGSFMHVIGAIPSGLPHIGLPNVTWSWELVGKLLPTAFAMFVVILAQSAATSRAYASKYNDKFNENTDLVGLSMANLGAGLSGTFVVNGSPTKTQMVDSAGGRSQLSQLITSFIVLVVILFFTAPLAYMPEAVLSAVVFLIGIELINFQGMKDIYMQRRSEFIVASITMITVVIIGVEEGIILAIILSLIDHVRRGYRPKNTIIIKSKNDNWEQIPVSDAKQIVDGLIIYRFTHSMYYANSQWFLEQILCLTKTKDGEVPIKWFCIDASSIDDVDYSAAQTLRSLYEQLKERGIRLVVTEILDDVKEQNHYKLLELFGQDAYYKRLEDVVKDYEKKELKR